MGDWLLWYTYKHNKAPALWNQPEAWPTPLGGDDIE
jgi:hypothetical protein